MSSDRPSIRLAGDDQVTVTVTWGRSGKRAIITVSDPTYGNPRQILLTPEHADALGRFLSAGPNAAA